MLGMRRTEHAAAANIVVVHERERRLLIVLCDAGVRLDRKRTGARESVRLQERVPGRDGDNLPQQRDVHVEEMVDQVLSTASVGPRLLLATGLTILPTGEPVTRFTEQGNDTSVSCARVQLGSDGKGG